MDKEGNRFAPTWQRTLSVAKGRQGFEIWARAFLSRRNCADGSRRIWPGGAAVSKKNDRVTDRVRIFLEMRRRVARRALL